VFQTKLLVNLAAGVTIFLLTIPFARTSSDAYHEKVAAFFKRMKTPIDLEKEVGELSDGKQLVIMGRFAMTAGALITLLCLAVDTSKGEHWAVLFVAGTVISVGSMLNFAGMRYNTKAKHIIAQRKQDVEAACATETAS
jgi:hypothetical protein